VFISYIMLAADKNFPRSASHQVYIESAMNGVAGYEVFPLKAGLKIKVEVGDIFNKPRVGGNNASHSEVVYSVFGEKAYLIGGNIGDSISLLELNLKNGYIDDTSDVLGYVLCVKKTDNKYYNEKKLIGTGTGAMSNNNTSCPAIGNKGFAQNSGNKSSIDKILAGKNNCPSTRDCVGSLAGLKLVPTLWDGSKLTKRGVVAMSQAIDEGFGSAPSRKNPGNLRPSSNKGFKTFSTWQEGYEAYSEYLLGRSKTGWSWSNTLADCYVADTNKLFKNGGVKYQDLGSYAYTKNTSPSLRQYINQYAPWGDKNNPSNYALSTALTLKSYGFNVDIDEPMNTWI